jgi:23S rRNA (adenine2030-N6)-methyltransferase
VLCDPSYEIKSDYAKVAAMMGDALKRFATGTYAVWYPIIPGPKRTTCRAKLKTLATKAGKSWLNATLTVKSSKITDATCGATKRPGLPASGMFVINPPYTLKAPAGAGPAPDGGVAGARPECASFGLDSGVDSCNN